VTTDPKTFQPLPHTRFIPVSSVGLMAVFKTPTGKETSSPLAGYLEEAGVLYATIVIKSGRVVRVDEVKGHEFQRITVQTVVVASTEGVREPPSLFDTVFGRRGRL
jgi:hypothetical protein